jgi:hypothetical protein
MKKEQKQKAVPKTVERARMYVVDGLASALAIALSLVHHIGDEDLRASLERIDALLFHEATSFLKLPYVSRERRSRKRK